MDEVGARDSLDHVGDDTVRLPRSGIVGRATVPKDLQGRVPAHAILVTKRLLLGTVDLRGTSVSPLLTVDRGGSGVLGMGVFPRQSREGTDLGELDAFLCLELSGGFFVLRSKAD